MKQVQAEVYYLEEKGEKLYSIMGGCRELKTRTPAAKSLLRAAKSLQREVIGP